MSLYFSIITSPKTPIDTLKQIPALIENVAQQNPTKYKEINLFTDTLLAKFVLHCRNNHIDIKKPPFEYIIDYISEISDSTLKDILNEPPNRFKEEIKNGGYHFYTYSSSRDLIDLIQNSKNAKEDVEKVKEILLGLLKQPEISKEETCLLNNTISRLQSFYDTKTEYDEDVKKDFLHASMRSMSAKIERGFGPCIFSPFNPECYKDIKSELLKIINISTQLHSLNKDFDFVPSALQSKFVQNRNNDSYEL